MHREPRFALRDGMELAGLGVLDLWVRYLGTGGYASLPTVHGWVMEGAACSDDDHDLVALTLNEVFAELGYGSSPVGYRGLPVESWVGAGSRSRRACARAEEAHRRSSTAAREAASLHTTAAHLMQASGQLQLARRARARALEAQARSTARPLAPQP